MWRNWVGLAGIVGFLTLLWGFWNYSGDLESKSSPVPARPSELPTQPIGLISSSSPEEAALHGGPGSASQRKPDQTSRSATEETGQFPQPFNAARWEQYKRAGAVQDEQRAFEDDLAERALFGRDPDEREAAVWELGVQEPTEKVVRACLEALRDPDPRVRLEAVQALEVLNVRSAEEQLRFLSSNDPDATVRESAADVVRGLQSPE